MSNSGWPNVFALPLVIYQAAVTPVQAPPAARVPQGLFDAQFAKPFPVVEQQFSTFARGSVPTAVTPQGFNPQSPDAFTKPFPAAEQQFATFTRGSVPSAPAAQGWSTPSSLVIRYSEVASDTSSPIAALPAPQVPQVLSPEVMKAAFSPGLQQFATFGQPITVAANTKVNWQSLSPDVLARAFPAPSQQFLALGITAPASATNGNGISGDFGNVVTRPALIYQAGVTPLFPQTAASNTAVNWQGLSPEVFGKTFPAASQQYAAHTQRSIPIIATPGWEGVRLDYAFAKPLAAAQQQYTGFFVGSPAAPQGSAGHQLNISFAKPFAAAQQQFLALMQPLVVLVNTTTWRQQPLNPEQFKASFPAALQPFDALGLVPIVPVVTNLPGHGDWPRHLKKKVRPIWDRRPDPYPTPDPEPDAAATPIAGPEPAIAKDIANDEGASRYLTRVLVPELSKPSKPTRKVKRAQARAEARAAAAVPVIARADLADDLDTGSALAAASIAASAALADDHDTASATASATHLATVLGIDEDEAVTRRSRARLEVGEENDALSAHATWNDDEIALRLLLGDDTE